MKWIIIGVVGFKFQWLKTLNKWAFLMMGAINHSAEITELRKNDRKIIGLIFVPLWKERFMRIALKNSTIDKYFGFLSKLDNISKKRLIVKLTESIGVNEKKSIDLKSLYGAWEDSRTSDEIIKDIRNSRVEKKSIDL